LGQKEAAQAAFDELYEIAAPENWARPFLEDREVMLPYLQKKPASRQRDYIIKTLGETPTGAGATPDQSALIEPLNDRELTVLRQISGGCSNKEIGEQMFLSVNTVRWYASQIYMKLGVKNRTEAVAKARELGIL
jgi:LuxR family maltose regulon positive regulatory protein